LLPISGLAAATVGFILGLPCMKTKTYYLSLVTMAFTLIVYLLLNNLNWTGGPDGISGIPFPEIGSYSFGSPFRVFGLEIPFQANFYYSSFSGLVTSWWSEVPLLQDRAGLNATSDEVAAMPGSMHV
jgi:branched-chain amino acid transport system permease protein